MRTTDMSHPNGWSILRKLICVLVAIYMLAPLAIVVILSFSSAAFLTFPPPGFSLHWYQAFVASPSWMTSFATTLLISVPATLLATAAGTAAAIGVARGRIPFPAVVSGLVMSPLVVPTIITAAAIFNAFQAWGLSGTFGGMILAHTLLSVPYVFTVVLAALRTAGPDVEGAALTLGATPARVLFRITLPMIAPAITSGMLFAAVASFDELVVSMFLSAPEVRPITVLMWSDILGQADPTISAIATTLFIGTLGLLLLNQIATRRSRSVSAGIA
jgi:putative spermidine/putrescine transport system permease protein